MTRISPEKRAEQVLSVCRIKVRPIPLETILEREGIRKAELPAGDECFWGYSKAEWSRIDCY
jgi:hypothetical protein